MKEILYDDDKLKIFNLLKKKIKFENLDSNKEAFQYKTIKLCRIIQRKVK